MFIVIGIAVVVVLGLILAGTINYERAKVATTNTTGMIHTLLVSEQPDAVGAIGGTGTTGILDAHFEVDADESGGADVQKLWKITCTPQIASDGKITLKIDATPVKGDATDGAVISNTFNHEETMDAWQTAAGRARQA